MVVKECLESGNVDPSYKVAIIKQPNGECYKTIAGSRMECAYVFCSLWPLLCGLSPD